MRRVGGIAEMKYIGRAFEYVTDSGITRVAKCTKIEFHAGIGKWLFIGVSPNGHRVRLTRVEIHRFI